MARIQTYSVDSKVSGNDIWIGSDGDNSNKTKNFSPIGLAEYFNTSEKIDKSNTIAFTYQTLDPGEDRSFGTISFADNQPPYVLFSDINNILISKRSSSLNYVDAFLSGTNETTIILQRGNSVNEYGLYNVLSINEYLEDENFFVFTLGFIQGNGGLNEDREYLFSVFDFSTKTSNLINDGEDGVNPFITLEDVPSITIDATPTDGSANAVSSNGVFDGLANKENTITAGTTSQYFRGDKTFQTLDKTAVGLGNVDNTSDLNKPISTATQTALNNKQDTLTNPITGTGANGQVAFWNGANSQTGDNGLFWDNTNKRLGVGTTAPAYGISHIGSIGVASFFSQRDFGANALSQLTQRASFIGYTFNDGANGIAMGANGTGAYIQGFTGALANPSARQIVLQTFGGNVGIGVNPSARLDVRAQGALSTDIAFRVRNSADTANLFSVAGNGNVNIISTNPTLTIRDDSGVSTNAAELVINNTVNAITSIRMTQSNANVINRQKQSQTQLNSNGVGGIAITAVSDNSNATTDFISKGFASAAASVLNMRITNNGNVLIGTSTDIASSKLTVESTTQGFLPPRMTNAQRLAIASPAIGLMVYCTDMVEGLYVNKSTGWQFII
jgi:hypothetical protein